MARVDSLSKVSILSKDSFEDHRGQLFTIWEQADFPLLPFNHDKIAISKKNVLRGLHTDKSWKLITCVYGKIQLIVVDINPRSDNYLNHLDITIDSKDLLKTSVLVPPGMLNGHLVLSEEAVFHYKWSYEGSYPDANEQLSVNWADPKLSIDWKTNNPILSERDKNTKFL